MGRVARVPAALVAVPGLAVPPTGLRDPTDAALGGGRGGGGGRRAGDVRRVHRSVRALQELHPSTLRGAQRGRAAGLTRPFFRGNC